MNRAILVKSCQKNRDSRWLSVAESWVKPIREAGVSVYGLFGRCFLDIVLWNEINMQRGDEYAANSDKLKFALTMALLAKDTVTHWFICDDDTFVHPQRWLAHEPTGDLECRLYQPRNALEWKKNNGRPWIHGGAGWWMSRRMCELYVEHCKERTSADDIVAARIAQEHGIELIDRPDLYGDDSYGGEAGWVSKDNSLITCHPVAPDQMRTIYEATNVL